MTRSLTGARTLLGRLAWLVALWLGGVLAIGAAALVMRAFLPR